MKRIDSNSTDFSLVEKIKIFFRLISQTFKGNYKPNKWNLIISFISIIYVISPLDFIPEIPFGILGLIDDVAILTFAYTRFNKEIVSFIAWENKQKPTNNSVINID
ncbi:MAG: YkvA family protein [Solirubrobacteraceae bacterium]